MNFKPGDLIRIKRCLNAESIRCVNIQTADWYEFRRDQIGLYLKWNASKHYGLLQQALILIEETKCYVDEHCIELIPVNENSL